MADGEPGDAAAAAPRDGPMVSFADDLTDHGGVGIEEGGLDNIALFATILKGITDKGDISEEEWKGLKELQRVMSLNEQDREEAIDRAGLISTAHLEDMIEESEHYKWGQLDQSMKFIDTHAGSEGFIVRPFVHQYYYEGALYREREERKVLWTELFYDLIFVSSIAILADGLKEGFSPFFFPIFFMIYQTWSLFTLYLNMYRPSDSAHKFGFALQMMALVGMGANILPVFAADRAIDEGETPTHGHCFKRFAIFHIASRSLVILQFLWAAVMYDVSTERGCDMRLFLRYQFVTGWLPFYIFTMIPMGVSISLGNEDRDVIFALWLTSSILDFSSFFCFAGPAIMARWAKWSRFTRVFFFF
jgi:Bacterial low temperature requirement A protein (LtrA)